MSKAKWPKTFWILTCDDIAKGVYEDDEGRRCLSGWIRNHFFDNDIKPCIDDSVITKEFANKLKSNLMQLGSEALLGCPIPIHNDHGGLSNDKLAEAWNMTLADFGYVEINESEWEDYE